MAAVLCVFNYDSLEHQTEKIVGTNGAVKRPNSCVILIMNHCSMCLQVQTCREILVTMVAEV